MLEKIKDLSVVRLITGEMATIVHIYDNSHFTIEVSDGDLRDIDISEIKEITCEPLERIIDND